MTTPPSTRVDVKEIDGVALRDLEPHLDSRGSFVELMRASSFDLTFRQSNLSCSSQGVLRGLHFHRRQADLWFLLEGKMQVGLVDIRAQEQFRSSSFILASQKPQTLLIPPGVAHGFLALADCQLLYWVTEEFDASDEYGVSWNDPSVGIPWQCEDPILSPRDSANSPLDWDALSELRR
jgi:dTDP-4-dehydrorhamnose 3,5-epimerase